MEAKSRSHDTNECRLLLFLGMPEPAEHKHEYPGCLAIPLKTSRTRRKPEQVDPGLLLLNPLVGPMLGLVASGAERIVVTADLTLPLGQEGHHGALR